MMQTTHAQSPDATIQFVISAIELYLQRHPDSADTAEGIHQWWIEWPQQAESLHITLLALQELEKRGLICAQRIGNREIWRRPRPPSA
ncbi:hypothetical protein V8J88_25300 [Massilia sp. W12]|uniref:hypothetical protein n=1 Tax=Massilia sp. W12 TaxID=3126507 RepID=UPI0030D18334